VTVFFALLANVIETVLLYFHVTLYKPDTQIKEVLFAI